MLNSLLTLLVTTVAVSAADLTIPVGEGELRFTLNVGDYFNWIFVYKNLNVSIVQTSLTTPCTPLDGGFSSGFVDPGSYAGGAANFTIQITSPQAIYFAYEGTDPGNLAGSACPDGAFGCINCSLDDFDTLVSNDANSPGTVLYDAHLDQGSPKGSGVFAQVVSLDAAFDVPFWGPSATSEEIGWATSFGGFGLEPTSDPTPTDGADSGSSSSFNSHNSLSKGVVAAIAVSVTAVLLGIGVLLAVRRHHIQQRLERFAVFRSITLTRLNRVADETKMGSVAMKAMPRNDEFDDKSRV